jgi:hypothetical protein
LVKDLKSQLIGAVLVILTVATVICAGINYQQQKLYHLPEDGVTWMDKSASGLTAEGPVIQVVAVHVEKGGPAEASGIKVGDVLLRIGAGNVNNPTSIPIREALDVARILSKLPVWGKASYHLRRGNVEIEAMIIVADANRDTALYAQYLIGLAWLVTGLFLFFRRGRAPRAMHFYLICLSAFVLFTFHYTGKLNNFDTVIYFGNVVAGLALPALFLHFCLTFPGARKQWGAWQVFSVYLPYLSLAILQLGFALGVVRTALPIVEMRWVLDRAWLLLFTGTFAAGAAILHLNYRRTEDPILRQQLKWLRNGVVAGIVPFAAFYAAPFVLGSVPDPAMRLAVLSMAVMPLAWAYAILRYRLMDVDIIFQQGYVYVLATLSVMAIVYMFAYALSVRDGLSPTAVILLVLVAAIVFEPLRNWIQQQLDRYVFYKDRYDYRLTLIAFARELGSEMDLDHALRSVGERLIRTLSVQQVAFFLSDDEGRGFKLHTALDREGARKIDAKRLDLSFLSNSPKQPYLFFERTRHILDAVSRREYPPSVRETISELELTYYLPCAYRGRTLAWMGVSRSTKGDFLSSDDVDLLSTLSGYVAMAVENGRLYRSLADKAEQYERLKEFSENIVESINVGILAADLEDRVESWNSQMERLSGIPRERAVGKRLHELFPQELTVHFDSQRGDSGVLQIYKIPLQRESLPGLPQNGNGNGHAAGREATVNMAIAPLVTKEGERIGRLVIFDDVTEREELERRLVQADKLSSIGLLAAGVAHEVNTPLAVISTYAQMLAKQVHGDDQKTRLLDKIAKQTFRASEIVNSLLNFSRTSSTDFDEVDVNKVIRETIILLEHQLEKANVHVESHLAEEIPLVRGNNGKLQQVFLNLVLNARDAMNEMGGGVLRVHTKSGGFGVQVEISDTGPGIPRDHLARIFDPFFTTKGSKKGTGLGLSVTYGIVEEHGGMIEADSDPGQGATFRLEFPAARKPVNA